jgi:anti-sigma regulatory factor (Ser/Thr protein kinase)
MPMPPTFQRILSRDLNDYLTVAAEVERFCAEQGLPGPVSFKVCLVLEELVLNLIDHAIGSATDRIGIRIDVEPGRVVLVLEDDAAPFDPRSAPAFDKAKPLEARGPRGMGIHLVRSMTEDIAYERVDSRNRLRVVIAG